PTTEAHNVFDASDEDIYRTVMEARGAREQLATLGAGHHDDGDDGPVESAPTRNEALQATLLPWKHTKDLNDPFACKLEI
ncbi:hypothetical protein J3R83DRAFT_12595, partial [Lanmaoa asiatica]